MQACELRKGKKIALIQAIYPKEMDAFRHNLANFRANNFQAESVYQTTKRVAEFVKTLKIVMLKMSSSSVTELT